MGLRLRDSGVSSDNGSNYIPKFDVGEGKTTIMAVNPSGRNFMVESNVKIDEKGRMDDVDETSSGYSSRESHCGENQERVHRTKVQKPSKMALVLKDNGRTIQEKETIDNDERTTESLSNVSNAVSGLQVNDASLNIKQFSKNLQRFSSVGSQTDDNVTEYFLQANGVCSCFRDCSPGSVDHKVFRQPRIDLENDTVVEIPPDKISQERESEMGRNKNVKRQEETETQTEIIENHLLEECKHLRLCNVELEEKLSQSNNEFGILVKELEKELLNAATEISQLKKQLRTVGKLRLQASPCAGYGYSSDGDIVEIRTVSNSIQSSLGHSDARKASSMDNLHRCTKPSLAQISVKTDMLKSLLKGQSPDKIKLSLLEKNKSLKDEINSLKTVEQMSGRRERPPSVNNVSPRAKPDDSETGECNATTNRRACAESEPFVKAREKTVSEDVRWRTNVKIIRRPKNSTAAHPQYTSAAFRTIHVTRWGQNS